jgi:hypothetical protein
MFLNGLATTAEPGTDDPVDSEAVLLAASSEAPSVSLRIDSQVPVDGRASAMVTLDIAEATSEMNRRTPLDLVAVIDISGSMSGTKIEKVRETVSHIVEVSSPSSSIYFELIYFIVGSLCQRPTLHRAVQHLGVQTLLSPPDFEVQQRPAA